MSKTTFESNLTAIVANNDELELLKALQLKLAHTIDSTSSARDLAPLSKQLREVTEKISELEQLQSNGDTVLDEIRRKHAANRVR